MKIRKVILNQFRSFRGERPPISFVDDITGLVRPLTVLVGSNGSGKTTIFDVIEGMLSFAWSLAGSSSSEHGRGLGAYTDPSFGKELRAQGFAALEVEFGESAPATLRPALNIALGREDRAPAGYQNWRNLVCVLTPKVARSDPRDALATWISSTPQRDLTDGLLYFPHNRWIQLKEGGGIEPPGDNKQWLFHFQPYSAWRGSLSHLWVWQNYLDLEEGQAGRKNLAPFVETIETILGQGQRIVIRQGRVLIHRPRQGDEVEPHQLPSGEQQILTLFGELARQLRPGAVVLIDEVENSLHPALQRAVLYHLRNLARRYDLQVILSTHSMEVVSAVAPEEIINLDDMVLKERSRLQAPEVAG